jgi:hypothetical protein
VRRGDEADSPTRRYGARIARVALREKGHKFRNDIIAAAVKARKSMCPQTDRDTFEELS